MSLVARLKRIGIDTYLLLLAGTVLLATVLPVSGDAAVLVKTISVWAVALLCCPLPGGPMTGRAHARIGVYL